MTLIKILREHLDSLLHPSVRGDAMTSARHRSFIALRMGGGLAVLSGVPVYLAIRGAPSMIEVIWYAVIGSSTTGRLSMMVGSGWLAHLSASQPWHSR